MGFFAKIFSKIFPSAKAEEIVAAPPAAASGAAPAASPVPAGPASIPLGEVAPILDAMPGAKGLNWRTSIVDLLKLLGLDSSLAARKELASELGCPADKMGDSAQMNMWLHKTVLHHIAANGGNVPRELLD